MREHDFAPILGITLTGQANPLMLKVEGDVGAKESLKQMLTLRHISNYFKVKEARETLRILSVQRYLSDWERRKLEQASKTIQELGDEVDIEMFVEQNRELFVPVGYYWLGQNYKDFSPLNELVSLKVPDGVSLRDYQLETIEKMLKYKRSTGVLATGLGKSLIILAMCNSLVAADKRVCVVVPTTELVGQMYGLIKKHIDNTTALGGKFKTAELGASVLVTTVQSSKKEIDAFDAIILDEQHHATASTWMEILTNCEKAEYVYGLTATPFREDGMEMALHAFCGKIVIRRTARWGIEQGWLKPLDVFLMTVPVRTGNGNNVLEFQKGTPRQKAYKGLVQSTSVFGVLKEQVLKAAGNGRKVIVLFKTVTAGKAFIAFCGDPEFMGLATGLAKKPLDRFRNGELTVLVSNDRLVSEGIDIPDCNCLFNVLNNKSRITTFQATGRVLRKTAGNAIVIDITCSGYKPFREALKSRRLVYGDITDSITLVQK